MADEQSNDGQGAAGEQAPQQQFALQRVYVKDLSFESPTAPGIFTQEWKPQMNVDLNTRSTKVDDNGNFEVVLTITITAKLNDETAFLNEIQQGGIFLIQGIEGEDLRRILATTCPNMLFPYARETIDSVITKGTFPPVMMAPVNFDALYLQALKQAQEKAAGGDAEAAPESTH